MAITRKCSDCGETADFLENINHKKDCKKLKKKSTTPIIRQKRKKLTEADKKKARKILGGWGLNESQINSILTQRGIPSLNEIDMMIETGKTLQDLRKINHVLLDLGIIEEVDVPESEYKGNNTKPPE